MNDNVIQPNGWFELEATGLIVHELASKYQRGEITRDSCIFFKKDFGNKYDKDATGIFVYVLGEQPLQIGWIPKAINAEFAEHIRKQGSFTDIRISKIDPSIPYLKIMGKAIPATNPCKEIPFRGGVVNQSRDSLTSGYTSSQFSGFVANTSGNSIINTTKESKMQKIVDKVIADNSTLATSAAFLEAGRIANTQAVKLAGKHLPMMVRGYADTVFGKLVLANAASTAAAQFRPNDKRLKRLTESMVLNAWQDVYQSFDIESMIDEMLTSSSLKRAFDNIDAE
jgi:hypothetical protein